MFALLLGAATAAGAYQVRAHLALPSIRRAAAVPVDIAPPPQPPILSAPMAADLLPAVLAHPPGQPASSSHAGAARAELRLLRQARAAIAREDHAAALPFLAEHVRRFNNGRLAEEREALRVKALAGAGRLDEAQLAAAAFPRASRAASCCRWSASWRLATRASRASPIVRRGALPRSEP